MTDLSHSESRTVPKRIQRKRTAGFKMPYGTVYVGRPGPYGNPFPASDPQCQQKFRKYVTDKIAENPTWLEPLRNKNLSCWCPLTRWCHADDYLRIANQ